MDILLINPPSLNRGRKIENLRHVSLDQPGQPYYHRLLAMDTSKYSPYSTFTGEHLGLQSLQASLQAAGHHVVVLNACIETHTTLTQTFRRIQEHEFDLVGFSGPLDVFAENLWLARKLRELGYTGHITLGHDFATLNHRLILERFLEFDSVVRGEGEKTICELATALEYKQSLNRIQGLSFRVQQDVMANPSRQPCDLDQLPWVTRYDLQSVLKLGMSAGIYTKRGCPYQCTFCTTGQVPLAEGYIAVERWRKRSPQNVVDEMQFLTERFGVRRFTIVDDLYISKGVAGSIHAIEIAEEILQRHFQVEYMIDCRIDSISAESFALLKRSGLRKVFIGVENGSRAALNAFNKGYEPRIIRQQLQILHDLDIEMALGFIFFNPIDSIHDLEQSYQLLLDSGLQDFALFTQGVRVYPGTELHRSLERQYLITGEFPYFLPRYSDTVKCQVVGKSFKD